MYYRQNDNVVEEFQQPAYPVALPIIRSTNKENYKPVQQTKEDFTLEINTNAIDLTLIVSILIIIVLLAVPFLYKNKETMEFVVVNYLSKLIIIVILAFLLNNSKC